jgi:hypothetical protein
MIAEYNRKSFYWGIPGIIVQSIGFIAVMGYYASTDPMSVEPEPMLVILMRLVTFAGAVLLLVGLSYYAKAKGRNPFWCLFAFVPCFIGIIVLACLKDRTVTPVEVMIDGQPVVIQVVTPRLASYSFICGILGILSFGILSIPGLILGIIALRKISNDTQRFKGRGWAIAGIFLSSIWLVLILFFVVLAVVA